MKFFASIIMISACFAALSATAQCISGDCANGEGTALVNKQTIYTGSFKDNLPEGRGSFRTADYIVYDGEVKHGLYNGMGTLYYENGDVYIGHFMNGMRHGEGEYRNKDGVKRSNYFYNGVDRSDMLTDWKNQNGIYTSYAEVTGAVLSNNKVGVFTADHTYQLCEIYDASTGQLQEKVNLPSIYEYNRTRLYLDFGTEFYDTSKNTWKMYERNFSSWANWHYHGKSVNGEAIFSQWNSGKESTRLFTMKTYDSKPHVIYEYKGGKYNTVNAVASDLSKIVKDGVIIDINDRKKTPVQLHDYKDDYEARIVFTSSGDSLFLNDAGTTIIYSAVTGDKLSTVPKLDYHMYMNKDYSFSADPYLLLRIMNPANESLVVVEKVFDKKEILPLIDRERNFIAFGIYLDKEIKYLDQKMEFEEREHRAYVKKMEALYGPDWNKDNGGTSSTTKQNIPADRKCTFCYGSGVTANYVTGQEITQDKNGRWYHANLAKTGTCPMCNGTGFLKK